MSNCHRKVLEWHEKFNVPVKTSPAFPGPQRAKLRADLITEESGEFKAAAESGDLTGMADALADLLYVCYGAAIECGIPLDIVFDEVHRSNMTKVWPDGSIRYREDGKVMKPPTYSPASIRDILFGKEVEQ